MHDASLKFCNSWAPNPKTLYIQFLQLSTKKLTNIFATLLHDVLRKQKQNICFHAETKSPKILFPKFWFWFWFDCVRCFTNDSWNALEKMAIWLKKRLSSWHNGLHTNIVETRVSICLYVSEILQKLLLQCLPRLLKNIFLKPKLQFSSFWTPSFGFKFNWILKNV